MVCSHEDRGFACIVLYGNDMVMAAMLKGTPQRPNTFCPPKWLPYHGMTYLYSCCMNDLNFSATLQPLNAIFTVSKMLSRLRLTVFDADSD